MLPVIQLPDLNPEFVLQVMSEVYDWGLIDLHIPEIHKQTLGSGIKISIIDSGESEHFEVENNKVASVNFTDSETLLDRNGHSSFVSGIVAAEKNNEGIIGVAPKASLYFAKGIDDAGRGEPSSLVRSVDWSIKQGVDIISISAGMFFDFKPLHKIIQKAHRKNIIVVAATGNTGKRHYDVAFPARYPEVIGVAAYDKKHIVAKFSSRGINVTCAMPGVDIYSTHLKNNFCKSSGTCLVGTTYVYTEKGPVEIRNINIGDRVFSFNEEESIFELKKITKKWNHGIKQTVFVKTKHSKIQCTLNHPFLIINRGSSTARWKTAQQMRIQDQTLSPTKLTSVKKKEIVPMDHWNVQWLGNSFISKPVCGLRYSTVYGFTHGNHGMRYVYAKHIIKNETLDQNNLVFGTGKTHYKIPLPHMSDDLSYLCGFYLGDGWITSLRNRNNTRRVYFAKCNLEFVNQRLQILFKNTFLHELSETRNNQYYCGNTIIADIFEQLCGSDKAKQKTIPQWIFEQEQNLQISFISGLLDSDGCIDGSRASIYSSSRSLIDRLSVLCDYAGLPRNNIHYRSRKIKAPNSKKAIWSDEYSFLINQPQNSVKVSHLENQDHSIMVNKSVKTSYITSISQSDDQEVFDIEVEGNHNFVANNMVVHNSYACPIMTGICALILSKHRKCNSNTPCETPSQMMAHLKKYAIKMDNGARDVGFGTIDLEGIMSN